MQQLKKRYKWACTGAICAFVIIILFLVIGAIGGEKALYLPWSITVSGTTSKFGIANISYYFFLNIFFCFGNAGWSWDFARIFIAAAFWADVLCMIIIGIVTSVKREKTLILPELVAFLAIIIFLWNLEGVTYARFVGTMRFRYVGGFSFCVGGSISCLFCCIAAIHTSHDLRSLEQAQDIMDDAARHVATLEERIKMLEEKVVELESRPVAVEAPVEEVVEETKEVETPVEETAPAEKGSLNIQRIPFSVKIAAADEDLREKFTDLSSYITETYGIKGRESIAGVSFSAHREKLVFVTVIGKHLRCNYALDATKYADSTMPVVNSDNKKYADVPLTLRVKSGLSYRRAVELVDDVMAAKGIEKIVK